MTAWSLSIDKNKPVTIEANSAQMDDKQGVSVYSGNVVITQEGLRITADKVTAHHEKDGMSEIVADGNPAHYEQADDGKNGPVSASANTIHYLTDKDKIVLNGNAKLEQQGNTLQGPTITYDIKSKIGNAGGNSGNTTQQKNGRVKMIFQPKPKSSNAQKKPATEVKKP